MTPLVGRKKHYFSTTSMLCDLILAFHHCTGSQQSASRGRVLAFYRIAPSLNATRTGNGFNKIMSTGNGFNKVIM